MRRTSFTSGRLSSQWSHSPARDGKHNILSSMRQRSINSPGRTRPQSSRASSYSPPWNTTITKEKRDKKRVAPTQRLHTHRNPAQSAHSSLAHEAVEQIVGETIKASRIKPKWRSREEELEYTADFYRVLDAGQPRQLMTTMTDPRSAELVGSLPQAVFIEALHRLSPAYFVEPFRDLHHPLPSWASLIRGVKRAEEHFDNFVQNLFTIVRFRTSGPYPLDLAEYTHLLDCARSMGNGAFADDLWKSMERDNVVPDSTCFNHWMEAQVWDHCYTGKEAYRMRVLPRTYKKRRMHQANIGWRGYGTGMYSLRSKVLPMFQQMMEAGHVPDERTYINVLLASARTGHNPGMRHILQTVWNIDVDAVKEASDPSTLQPPTPYQKSSALYPTENLLFAVAHALGTNNDILGAVQVIQFISSHYDIKVPAKVWHELLERAFVLSRNRPAEIRNFYANTLGKISGEVVRSIFETMTSKPHNIATTGQTWRFMLKTASAFGTLQECRSYMSQAYKLLLSTREQQEMARQLVVRLMSPLLRAPVGKEDFQQANPDLLKNPLLSEAINLYDIKRLELYQQTQLFQLSTWNIVAKKRWEEIPNQSWFYQERPKMLEEWQDFLPKRIRFHYGADTGVVDFQGESGVRDRHWHRGPYAAVRRSTEHKEPGFIPDEVKESWDENGRWNLIKRRYPWLDTTAEPINTLFTFQVQLNDELRAKIKELRETWVEYPEDHPLANTGFHGRIVALGLEKSKERSSFLLDKNSLI